MSKRNDRIVYPFFILILTIILSCRISGSTNSLEQTHAETFRLKRKDDMCLTIADNLTDCVSTSSSLKESCVDKNLILFERCDENNTQQRWLFDFQEKRIYPNGYKEQLCLDRQQENISVSDCQHRELTQMWFFDQQDRLLNRKDFHDEFKLTKLVNKYKESQLFFNFIDTETDENRCFLSPFTGRVECGGFEVDDATIIGLEKNAWQWSGLWLLGAVKMTNDIQISDESKNLCLSVTPCHIDSVGQYDCFGGSKVNLASCAVSSYQIWRYDLISKRIINKQAGDYFCLSWLSDKLTLEYCRPGTVHGQMWYFAMGKGKGIKHGEKGRLRWFSSYRNQYNYIQSLDFDPILKFQFFDHDNQNNVCSYHPVTGVMIGQCDE